MSDPIRLRDGGDEFARFLTRSAESDHGPEDGAARALAALGIASSIARAAAVSVTPKASAAGLTSLTAVKLTALGIIGLGVISAAVIARHPDRPVPIAPPPKAQLQAPVVREVVPDVTRVVAPVEAPVIELPEGTAPPPVENVRPRANSVPAPPLATGRAAPEPQGPVLADEIAYVDQARADLGTGELDAAGATLDAYDLRFPDGALRLETKVARIEIALARFDGSKAIELAERFLRDHPRSAYDRRVRVLLERARLRRALAQ